MRDFLASFYELHGTRLPGAWRLRDRLRRARRSLVPGEVAASPRKLNLGCARLPLPGYLNVDGLAERRPDVVSPADRLEFAKDGQFDLVRASHLLEHFERRDHPRVLAEWRRVLAPGGCLVVCTPNYTRQCWRGILRPAAFDPSTAIGQAHYDPWVDGMFANDLPPPFRHKAVFTRAGLAHLLETNGFTVLGEQTFEVEEPFTLGIQDDSCSTFSLNLLARRT